MSKTYNELPPVPLVKESPNDGYVEYVGHSATKYGCGHYTTSFMKFSSREAAEGYQGKLYEYTSPCNKCAKVMADVRRDARGVLTWDFQYADGKKVKVTLSKQLLHSLANHAASNRSGKAQLADGYLRAEVQK